MLDVVTKQYALLVFTLCNVKNELFKMVSLFEAVILLVKICALLVKMQQIYSYYSYKYKFMLQLLNYFNSNNYWLSSTMV